MDPCLSLASSLTGLRHRSESHLPFEEETVDQLGRYEGGVGSFVEENSRALTHVLEGVVDPWISLL